MAYRIKDWKEFQHFKDRTPPWIKLHRSLLDNPDWHVLDGKAAKMLTMLWLLASEDKNLGGYLPDIRTISFRLRTTELEVKSTISKLNHWVVEDRDNMISERYQSDIPETETEAYSKEAEIEVEKNAQALLVFVLPDWIRKELWDDWMIIRRKLKAVNSIRAMEAIVRKLDTWRQNGHDPNAIIEKSITSSWKDVFEPKDNNHAATINNPRQYPKKPSWRSTGEKLAAKYRAEAEREEQGATDGIIDQDMRFAEIVWEDGR